jgi:hypothetical protein
MRWLFDYGTGLRSAAGLVLVLALLAVPAGAEAPPLPADERLLLAEAFRLTTELGEEIWPGWGVAPWEVLLVSGEHEYLVNSPRRPEGFAVLDPDDLLEGKVLVRSRTVPTGLRATYPMLGGPPLVVVGGPEATGLDPTAWLAMVLHEHFHQLQMSDNDYYADVQGLDLDGGDQSGNWMLDFPFPYDDPEVGKRFIGLCAAIRAVMAGDVPPALLAEALGGLAAVLPDDAYRYMAFQLWQEGVARYVQYRAARVAGERFEPSPGLTALPGYRPFSQVATELRQQILAQLAEPRLAEQRRIAFYAAGAGLAMLLEEQSPGWHRGYLKRKFALEGLLP